MIALNKKLILFFSAFILLIGISTCTVYNSVEFDPYEVDIDQIILSKEYLVIHNLNKKQKLLLYNSEWEGDTLKGCLINPPYSKLHASYKKTFSISSKQINDPLKTLHIYTSFKQIQEGTIAIPGRRIIGLETHDKKNISFDYVLKTIATFVLIVSLIFFGIIGLFYLVILLTCGCPSVEIVQNGSVLFQGNLFPGALLENLERKDYLIMDNVRPLSHEDFVIRISNYNPEKQFINKLELLQIQNTEHDQLGLDINNQIVAFNNPIAPKQINNSGTSIEMIKSIDGLIYSFHDKSPINQLNKLNVVFERSDIIDHPALIIHAKQSAWLDTVANFAIMQAGSNFNKWVRRNNSADPEKWKKKNINRGVGLNVYLKKNGTWEYINSFQDAGTSSFRDLVLELDVSKSNSPVVEIKLESAYKMWEVDMLGISNSYSNNINVETVELKSALTQDSVDVRGHIMLDDEEYFKQNKIGQFIELNYSANQIRENATLIMSGSGYFNKVSPYKGPVNIPFFIGLQSKYGMHILSKQLNKRMQRNPDWASID
jgi:hypothetical protein